MSQRSDQGQPVSHIPVPLRLWGESVDHRVVSVSLGSASRDKSVIETFMGKRFAIERIGTDGDRVRFAEWVSWLAGRVDAIGVGGTNLYLGAAGRRFAFREARQMVAGAGNTPVVDGYGLKEYLEPRVVKQVQADGVVDFRGARCLMVMGVDRFGMAKALHDCGARLLLGDFLFALGLPIRIHSWRLHQAVARCLLPFVVRLPFDWFYPTGKKEDVIVPRFQYDYRWADVIAGDFLFIKRHLPPPDGRPLEGKTVLTNTVTADDVTILAERGVKLLITTTPRLDGRSFATNVMEGVVVTLAGKRPESMTSHDYEAVLSGWKIEPRIERL